MVAKSRAVPSMSAKRVSAPRAAVVVVVDSAAAVVVAITAKATVVVVAAVAVAAAAVGKAQPTGCRLGADSANSPSETVVAEGSHHPCQRNPQVNRSRSEERRVGKEC